jgi:hypothetical protein
MENWESLLLKNVSNESVETQVEAAVETEEAAQEVVETTVEEVEVEKPIEAEAAITTEEEIIDLDEDTTTDNAVATVNEDEIFNKKFIEKFVGDALPEMKDKNVEEVLQYVKDKVTKKEVNALENVPEDLRKAIDLAKEGVNYKEYLKINNVNYDDFTDVDLYANSVASYFTDANGSVDEDKLNEHIESLSEVQLALEGKKLRNSLKQQQSLLSQRLIDDANRVKAEKINGVDNAVKSLDKVLNFQVNAYQKEKIKNILLKSDLSLFTSNGSVDYKRAAESVFKLENFDKIVNYLKTTTSNEVKKQILEPMTNATVRSTATPVQANSTDNPYKKAQQDLMRQLKGL